MTAKRRVGVRIDSELPDRALFDLTRSSTRTVDEPRKHVTGKTKTEAEMRFQ